LSDLWPGFQGHDIFQVGNGTGKSAHRKPYLTYRMVPCLGPWLASKRVEFLVKISFLLIFHLSIHDFMSFIFRILYTSSPHFYPSSFFRIFYLHSFCLRTSSFCQRHLTISCHSQTCIHAARQFNSKRERLFRSKLNDTRRIDRGWSIRTRIQQMFNRNVRSLPLFPFQEPTPHLDSSQLTSSLRSILVCVNRSLHGRQIKRGCVCCHARKLTPRQSYQHLHQRALRTT